MLFPTLTFKFKTYPLRIRALTFWFVSSLFLSSVYLYVFHQRPVIYWKLTCPVVSTLLYLMCSLWNIVTSLLCQCSSLMFFLDDASCVLDVLDTSRLFSCGFGLISRYDPCLLYCCDFWFTTINSTLLPVLSVTLSRVCIWAQTLLILSLTMSPVAVHMQRSTGDFKHL